MGTHISFEDLVAFVWMEKLTPELRELSVRVNRHLLTCRECVEQLEKLQEAKALACSLRRRQWAEQTFRSKSDNVVELFPCQREGQSSSAVYAASQPRTAVLEEMELEE